VKIADTQGSVSTSIVDYGIKDNKEVAKEHLDYYVKDDLGDLSRLNKIKDTLVFYTKDEYEALNKAKKNGVANKTDIYDSVVNPMQQIGNGTGDLTFQSLTQQSNRGLSWQLSAIDQSMRDIPYFQNGARWKATISTRNGIDLNSQILTGEQINNIQKDIKRLNRTLRNLIFEGEYYGFAGGLLVFSNDKDFEKPLDFTSIEKNSFLGIKTLTRLYRIIPDLEELLDVDDITSGVNWGANADMIGMPKYYRINLESGKVMGKDDGYKVHTSRILPYKTEHLSYVESRLEMNMGITMLEKVYPDMARYETLLGQTVKMAQRSNVPVLKSDTSMATLNSDEALLDIFAKLKRMKMAMSNSNMVVIDKDDDFSFENAEFKDVPTILNLVQEAFAYSIGAPMSAVFKGTNAKKEEEEAMYFIIESIQSLNMRDWFTRLIPIMAMNRYGKKISTMDFDFEFKSLYRQTEKEKAETLKMVGEFATSLYDRNGIDIETLIRMIQVAQTNVSDIPNEITKTYIEYAQNGNVFDSKIKNKINFDIELAKALNQQSQNENGLSGVRNPETEQGKEKGGNPNTTKKPTPTINKEKE